MAIDNKKYQKYEEYASEFFESALEDTLRARDPSLCSNLHIGDLLPGCGACLSFEPELENGTNSSLFWKERIEPLPYRDDLRRDNAERGKGIARSGGGPAPGVRSESIDTSQSKVAPGRDATEFPQDQEYDLKSWHYLNVGPPPLELDLSVDVDFALNCGFDYSSQSSLPFSGHVDAIESATTANGRFSLLTPSDLNPLNRSESLLPLTSPSSTSGNFRPAQFPVDSPWTNTASSKSPPSEVVPQPTHLALPPAPSYRCPDCRQTFASSAQLA